MDDKRVEAELTRRFEEDFDPATARMYVPGRGDELPRHVELQRAMAQRAFHEGEAARVMREAVAAARADGMSWGRIGAALGITGEAARQRWSHKAAS
jgi:hypothetical protein